MNTLNEYVYLGDRLTGPAYKGKQCKAVRRQDGKCIRGRNGNMLVRFENAMAVVNARSLRKLITKTKEKSV